MFGNCATNPKLASTMLLLLSAIIQCQCLSQNETDIIDKSKIDIIPPEYNHDIHAGYLNITEFDKMFYYMYFQSQNQKEDDPVIVWLGRAPKCSVLMSMATENGPFIFEKESNKMVVNTEAWNMQANLVYIESPAGVGFSKGKRDSLVYNDTNAAQDNYIALTKFFQKHPGLRDNDFYLAGQGYAGISIPRLSQQIIQNNQQQSRQDQKINLKGIIIGNGCTHPNQCYNGKYVSRYQVEHLYTRGFIDTADYSEYWSTCVTADNEKSVACEKIQQKIEGLFLASKANIYNIYGLCYPTSTGSLGQPLGISVGNLNCQDLVGLKTLFNTEQYREALRVESNQTLVWSPCSDSVTYTSQSRAAYSFLPLLIKYGLKIYYYSGDFDAMVPIEGTLDWLKKYRADFGASIKRNWRPWSIDGKKLGGMIWELDGITFWSVVGAGHMVTADRPKQAKYILDSFLGIKKSDEDIDKKIENQSKINQIEII